MSRDLTTSLVARSNILNNQYAVSELENSLQLGGLSFEGETVFTKQQVAVILDVDERTIERYIEKYSDELKRNGYRVLRGNSLKNIKLAHGGDTNVATIGARASILGIFFLPSRTQSRHAGYRERTGKDHPQPDAQYRH